MSAPKPYRVAVVEWTTWSTVINADSQEGAMAEAERLFADEGADAFKLRDSGIDDIEAECLETFEGGAR